MKSLPKLHTGNEQVGKKKQNKTKHLKLMEICLDRHLDVAQTRLLVAAAAAEQNKLFCPKPQMIHFFPQ